MLTPGISLGYWKARKMPARARSSDSISRMDLPSRSTSPCGDRVVRVPGDGLGQRGLAGAVRPHDGMDLAGVDRQGHTLDDFLVPDGDVKVVDFE